MSKTVIKIIIISCLIICLFSQTLFSKFILNFGKQPGFSHQIHLTEAGVECQDCHQELMDSNDPGMPDVGFCLECHEKEGAYKKLIISRTLNGVLTWNNYTELKDEVIFSHLEHIGQDINCGKCHKEIETRPAVTKEIRVTKDSCQACHNTNNIKVDCASCHQIINERWKPPSHLKNWKPLHGVVARGEAEPPYTNRCSLCHSESACINCHRDEQPRSHNAHWRHRGHGISAGMDRSRCTTCHQSYFCDICHRETSPRSHKGSWGNVRNRHCLVCHFPLKYESCQVCHSNYDSHLQATTLQIDINHQAATTIGCRACHIDLGTMLHLDKGDDCRICHK